MRPAAGVRAPWASRAWGPSVSWSARSTRGGLPRRLRSLGPYEQPGSTWMGRSWHGSYGRVSGRSGRPKARRGRAARAALQAGLAVLERLQQAMEPVVTGGAPSREGRRERRAVMRHWLLRAQAWWDAQRFDQPAWQVAAWRDQKVRHIQLHVAKALGKVVAPTSREGKRRPAPTRSHVSAMQCSRMWVA